MIEDNDHFVEKSKSQLKRELLALQDLGRRLMGLSDRELSKIPASETLLEAIKDARRFKHGAQKRQLQFIGGLMREEDHEAIQQVLDSLNQPKREAVKVLHKLEDWRDRLLKNDDALINQLVEQLDADRQYLRQLIRNATREEKNNKPPKSARVLFQYLQELHEQE